MKRSYQLLVADKLITLGYFTDYNDAVRAVQNYSSIGFQGSDEESTCTIATVLFSRDRLGGSVFSIGHKNEEVTLLANIGYMREE